ncbi:MAG: hypothetical protein AVDCRST_MAG87-3872 [uncultured Thermomicrobiales bacterium]|uniref:Uncharacterized protein n=1 Tax=uncultured Thermomicrobiales bacterium TaxID=1645740 RepID=A0A6J4VU30_9BACT|nr:MAG: hypothetical protein AVDCRST_MAG87-3872 [uncultured Thermomicrobiales bacterium]
MNIPWLGSFGRVSGRLRWLDRNERCRQVADAAYDAADTGLPGKTGGESPVRDQTEK